MSYRIRIYVLLVGLAVLGSGPALADTHFLPVDSAFAPHAARVDAHHVAVTWKIAKGYYLYHHGFKFKFVGQAAPAAGKPAIPKGNRHTDQFFGKVETYRHSVRAVVPVAGGKSLPKSTKIQVSYQGCADAGICYPPQTRKLAIAPALSKASPAPANTSSSSGNGQAPAQTALAQQLGGAHPLSTLLLFFGLGILLAFTPCILPMIPILSALVVGSGARPARAFLLSLVYVLAMALAYTVFGVIAGFFGANIQAALQAPTILLPFAALFVVLALASFGVFSLEMPSAWRARLGQVGTQRGGLVGAALMGFFAALIAGPCLAPPLVGALLYISTSGDMIMGGLALFMLGLGIGVPLILIATFGAGVLPRAGTWMDQIRVFFGVVLLGVAIWLASRVVPSSVALAGWGALALGYGAYLSTRVPANATAQACQRAGVFALGIYAACALVGIGIGQGRPARPLAGLTASAAVSHAPANTAPAASAFTRVTNLRQFNAALASAARAHRPAVVDFYADWCVDCVHMKHAVFAKPAVRTALKNVAAIEVDVTDYDAGNRKLMRRLNIFGPPALLFYKADGAEAKNHRIVGQVDTQTFLRHLRQTQDKTTSGA